MGAQDGVAPVYASASGEKKNRYAVGPSARKDKWASCNECQQAEQPDCGEAVDADIDGPHEPRRQVLQQPRHPQMRKERNDVIEAGVPFVSVPRFRGH